MSTAAKMTASIRRAVERQRQTAMATPSMDNEAFDAQASPVSKMILASQLSRNQSETETGLECMNSSFHCGEGADSSPEPTPFNAEEETTSPTTLACPKMLPWRESQQESQATTHSEADHDQESARIATGSSSSRKIAITASPPEECDGVRPKEQQQTHRECSSSCCCQKPHSASHNESSPCLKCGDAR